MIYIRILSTRIFNYNQTVKEFDDITSIECKCSEFLDYIHKEAEHVVTGDASIFKSVELINIMKKGPSYKEPTIINFNSLYDSLIQNIKVFIKLWSAKEHKPISCFKFNGLGGWIN